jgi:hypothetical protein
VANDVLPPEKTIVTGCARYDLCSSQWRRTLGEEAADYILVNANFSLVNPLLSSGEAAVKTTFKSVGHADAFIDELYSDTHHHRHGGRHGHRSPTHFRRAKA